MNFWNFLEISRKSDEICRINIWYKNHKTHKMFCKITKADKLLNLNSGLSSEEILKIEQFKLRSLSSILALQSRDGSNLEKDGSNQERVRPNHIQGL